MLPADLEGLRVFHGALIYSYEHFLLGSTAFQVLNKRGYSYCPECTARTGIQLQTPPPSEVAESRQLRMEKDWAWPLREPLQRWQERCLQLKGPCEVKRNPEADPMLCKCSSSCCKAIEALSALAQIRDSLILQVNSWLRSEQQGQGHIHIIVWYECPTPDYLCFVFCFYMCLLCLCVCVHTCVRLSVSVLQRHRFISPNKSNFYPDFHKSF